MPGDFAQAGEQLRAVLGKYRRSLQSDRRHLLEHFRMVQVARKVVGVGSVGTRAWVVLMDAVDGAEPLFLQAKEAQPSVLAGYCGRSKYNNQGERVVAGQHLMQAQSDIFLGWTRTTGADKFDQAIADFAETYADQNERDYAALQAAVKDGRAEATTEI
jgi:uncharacterized protein (DUF2252 family)